MSICLQCRRLGIPRLASVDVGKFTTSLTSAGMSPLVKGALASESTAGLLPLPDVDGCMTGVDTLDVALLALVAPGAAAVDLRFLFLMALLQSAPRSQY